MGCLLYIERLIWDVYSTKLFTCLSGDRWYRTPRPGTGGIFQFLTELVARQLSRMGLWVMTSPLASSLTRSRPCCGAQFLPQWNFTSSLTATATTSPPPQPSLDHFHRFRPIIWGYLYNPSWDPSLPAVSQSSRVCLKPAHWSIIKALVSWAGVQLPHHNCVCLVLVSQSHQASKVVISILNFCQPFVYLLLLLLTNQIFCLFSCKSVLLCSF